MKNDEGMIKTCLSFTTKQWQAGRRRRRASRNASPSPEAPTRRRHQRSWHQQAPPHRWQLDPNGRHRPPDPPTTHLWRLDPDVLIQLRVGERQLHGLLDLLDLAVQPAHIRVGLGGGVVHLQHDGGMMSTLAHKNQ